MNEVLKMEDVQLINLDTISLIAKSLAQAKYLSNIWPSYFLVL
jgi:hypothetical protein